MSEWMPIPSFPDYEASVSGDVRRRNNYRNAALPGKILKTFPTDNGYRVVHVSSPELRNGLRMVSRLVCEAFHGVAPTPKHQAAHRNGDRTDNRALNLSWLTRAENYEDQVLHGTHRRGERHHMSKLTESDVIAIREMAGMVPRKLIAKRFKIGESHICQIIKRSLWGHI